MIALKINTVKTQDYYSQALIEDVYEDFSKNKEMFDFRNYPAKSKYYDDSNKSVAGKVKDKTMYSFMVDDSSEHKKAKRLNQNIVVPISHNKYKDVLLNKKCLRHSMKRTQSKDHRIGPYEINKISLSCFDSKIYIQSNGYDGLAVGFQS